MEEAKIKKIYEQYFNEAFYSDVKPTDIKNIDALLSNEKMFIISGDFYGIQKFIFEGLATQKASKVLRAKSAFVQIFTEIIAKYICEKLDDKANILSVTAGKFEILSPKIDDFSILKDNIQSKIDDYFIQNLYGLSGMSLLYVECTKEDFDKENYKTLRDKVTKGIEDKKFNKFNLQHQKEIMNYDKDIDNESLCRICNIRKLSHENCDICNDFVKLGKKLAKDHQQELFGSQELGIDFDGFNCNIKLDTRIKSYVATNNKDEILDFETLAKNSCKDLETGLKAIAVLKADVDNMGKFIKDSSVTESFENFDTFSRTLDGFFSLHIPNKMKKEFPDTYTVFAGGDDLFLVGAWDEILSLARWIEVEFKKFVKSKDLTISFGIAITNPSTPISYLADHTEHLLEEAKRLDGKDAITLFGETVKWSSYISVFKELDEAFRLFENKEINTAFLYRLLEFCEMSKRVKKRDIKATMWKSKLRYSFSRNNDNLGENIYKLLDEKIDDNPSETKMFLSEFIYKRRK
ncbi:MAG: hypothetical protein JXQ76_12470 [Campylobacterales bacterium]|nr:hypothetical protein [Campylobacterales bacterium]